MKKRLITLLLIGTVALSFTGCGSSNSDTTSADSTTTNTENTSNLGSSKKVENQEVTLTESGYSINDDGMGDVYAYFGFTVNNPNTESAAQFPVVTITAKGEDGSIIATYDQTLYYIAPNDSVSFGSVLDCNGKVPATVEFSTSSGTFVSGSTPGVISTSSFAVSNTSEIVEDYGGTSYTGEVTNNSDSDLDNISVTVLLKNNGEIVYGDTTYVSGVTAGSTKPFELSEYNVPEHTEYVITAQSW